MGPSLSLREETGLTVRVDQDRDALLVRASGEIDIANAGVLREELARIWALDASFIVLDLGGVEFIDSTGLAVLLWAAGRSREDGNRLSIWLGASAAVRQLIRMFGLEDELPLIPSRQVAEALEAAGL